MDNVYDIRYKKSLSYIISADEKCNMQIATNKIYQRTAVILYFYYEDTAVSYFKYIDSISDEIHLYIISSLDNVLDIFRTHIRDKKRNNTFFILKENRGRDVSALLVTMKKYIFNYEYVAFVHDKKEHSPNMKKDTDLWIENLWGNILVNQNYIDKVLRLFEENENLGVLAPPDPIGDCFCTWYGYGWHGAFDITRELAEQLELRTDLDRNKPPITIGTVLWFRTKALKKLLEYDWSYSDFDDERLKIIHYVSYAVERIFPYVAQDAGYDTGEIMTLQYAQKQNNYLHYSTTKIFSEMQTFFPLPSIESINNYKQNLPGLVEFANQNNRIYLYGAGNMGRFCLTLLRRAGREPEAFVITDKPYVESIDAVPVYQAGDVIGQLANNDGVVITVSNATIQGQIIDRLKELGCSNYYVFGV